MEHVVEKSDSGAHSDLLRWGELSCMTGIFGRHNSFLGCFRFLRIRWLGEVGGRLVRRKDATVQGQRYLDLSLVGDS